jgi:hypothetical protein
MNAFRDWYGRHFLGMELSIATALSFAFCLWCEGFGGGTQLEAVLGTNRGAIYGTLASMLGTLLGFAITAISILLTMWPADTLQVLRDSGQGKTMWRTFTSCTRWLSAATALAVCALLFDTAGAPKYWLVYLGLWPMIVSVLRLVRTLWILEQVIDVIAAPPQRRGPELLDEHDIA